MRIGAVDLDERVLVVAEIGNNHEGSLEVARELVRRAADAGAGAVKLQTFRTEHFVRRRDAERFRQLSGFELPREGVRELSSLARELGLLFLSTPFDLDSASFLAPLVDAYKIASGDNDFFPLLEHVAEMELPVVVSAGLLDSTEIGRSVGVVTDRWQSRGIAQELAVLHCVSAYPVSAEHANLGAISALATELGCTVGYSDHTVGSEACVLAAALGARIIEKHFTLRHDFSSFRDHQLSADPGQLETLVERVNSAQAMVGPRTKQVQPEEIALTSALRRSIAAARDLPRGHRVTAGDLTWLRPRDGLAPGEEGKLLEGILCRDVAMGESLLASDIQ